MPARIRRSPASGRSARTAPRPLGSSKARCCYRRSPPDGRFLLYNLTSLRASRISLEVVEIDTGEVIFTTHVDYFGIRLAITNGRPRWMPDGESFIFVGTDEQGRNGVYQQDFVPGKDTLETRRAVAGFSAENDVESVGVSPDGTRLMISVMENLSSIKIAEGVPGVGDAK